MLKEPGNSEGGEEVLPGVTEPDSVRYVRVADGEVPEDVFNRVMAAWRPLIVKRGGASLANWRLKTPNGKVFVPVEYRIDFDDWSSQIELGAKALGIETAKISGPSLHISDGNEILLNNCEAIQTSNLKA